MSGQFLEEFRLHLYQAMIPLDSARERGLSITVACVRSLAFVPNPILYAQGHRSFKGVDTVDDADLEYLLLVQHEPDQH